MKVIYTPRYYADIGEGHVFPIRKFERVRDQLLLEGTLLPSDIIEPKCRPSGTDILNMTLFPQTHCSQCESQNVLPEELLYNDLRAIVVVSNFFLG
jgi:hypothetical protein